MKTLLRKKNPPLWRKCSQRWQSFSLAVENIPKMSENWPLCQWKASRLVTVLINNERMKWKRCFCLMVGRVSFLFFLVSLCIHFCGMWIRPIYICNWTFTDYTKGQLVAATIFVHYSSWRFTYRATWALQKQFYLFCKVIL